MNDGIFIFSPESSFYYELFLRSGFGLFLLILIVLAWQRKYPIAEWLIILLVGMLGFLIGSRLGGFSPGDWGNWFKTGQLPIERSQSLWGGLILGVTGIWLTKTWLSFSRPVFSLYIIAVPFSLLVLRMGCLVAGCCYGTPVEGSLGLQYGIFSPAFDHHMEMGYLSGFADSSLTVHAVPVYFMISYLIIGIILIRSLKTIQSDRRLAVLGLGLLASGRFFIEFFRDPVTNPGIQGDYWLGLKILQWFCLGIVLISGLVFFLSPKVDPVKATIKNTRYSLLRVAGLVLFVTSLIYYFQAQFSNLDKWVIFWLAFALVITVFIRQLYKVPSPVYRMGYIVLLFVGIGLMSQSVDSDSLKAAKLAEKQNLPMSWGTLRVGGAGGGYRYYNRDCDGSVTSTVHHRYRTAGLGYSRYFNFKNYRKANFDINLGLGYDQMTIYNNAGEISKRENINLTGFGAFGKYDFRWLGLGIGGDTGNMFFMEQNVTKALQTYARLGPYDILFIEGGTFNYFPGSLSYPSAHFAVGTGLGKLDGTEFKFGGIIGDRTETAVFLSGRFIVKQKLVLNPYLGLGKDNGVGLNVEYYFGRNDKKN